MEVICGDLEGEEPAEVLKHAPTRFGDLRRDGPLLPSVQQESLIAFCMSSLRNGKPTSEGASNLDEELVTSWRCLW